LTFVEVNIDAFKLVIVVTNVFTGGVNTVLGGHDLKTSVNGRRSS
jgi:hypothetical protein